MFVQHLCTCELMYTWKVKKIRGKALNFSFSIIVGYKYFTIATETFALQSSLTEIWWNYVVLVTRFYLQGNSNGSSWRGLTSSEILALTLRPQPQISARLMRFRTNYLTWNAHITCCEHFWHWPSAMKCGIRTVAVYVLLCIQDSKHSLLFP